MNQFRFRYFPKGTQFDVFNETANGVDIVGRPITFKTTTIAPKEHIEVVVEADDYDSAYQIFKKEYLAKF